jgi:hypothetical protein
MKCYLCGGGILTAVHRNATLTVDAVPHADGNLTLTRLSANGGWFARPATKAPYARQTPLYRVHTCKKPVAA